MGIGLGPRTIPEVGHPNFTIEDGKSGSTDVLVPADKAFQPTLAGGKPFPACLDAMSAAAEQGRDSTKDMVAKLGRSNRLGERSRGVIDAGAASGCLILQTTVNSLKGLLQ